MSGPRNKKPGKKPPATFQAFLKTNPKKKGYPSVHTWRDLRSAVIADGDEAIVEARTLWRGYPSEE